MAGKQQVMDILKTIMYPGFQRDIVAFGMVKDVVVEQDTIVINLDIRTKDENIINQVLSDIQAKVAPVVGSQQVKIQRVTEQPTIQPKPVSTDSEYLPNVKYKIAVASGKGGVGKSTVSVNLAVALAKLGVRVGLLDADIYGPSIPLMLGVTEKPEYDGKKLKPIERYGVQLMSLGFLTDDNSAVIWRGPLVMRAIQQLMRDVDWGNVDVILFDMPPGTGDAQLTLSQSVTLDGAVIVSTPQDVALLDATKGVQMFQKVNVPILGIVENMSFFACPHCGERTDIFSNGGVRRECDRLLVPFLGEIPIDAAIRAGGDEGKPIVASAPENAQAAAFMEIARNLKEQILAE
jgi:ATP-binding protein involved in chromosome partitioning